ncbi:MAG: class I SAM-dependent rRNA methyltransferase [Chloroflexi bacterium]|nr:class I SAM-dependent rRNA methyltransferase [Chloroflexota bacterium]
MAGTPSSSTSRQPRTADLPAILAAASARRQKAGFEPRTTAFRLLNREGDGLPGLAVDHLGEDLVLHAYSTTAGAIEPRLADLLAEQHPSAALYLKRHPAEAGRVTLADAPRLAPETPIRGPRRPVTVVRENGLAYVVRMDRGLSYGLFLDMREVRAWVQSVVVGREVLNLFAYTCAFGVAATAGGAARVLNVDLARPYLTWGKENYKANGFTPDHQDFVFGDSFDWLRRFARRGQRFGLVIVDPPSFSRGPSGTFSVQRDAAALVSSAAAVVDRAGILLVATNHAGMADTAVDRAIREGLRAAHRSAEILRSWHEPSIDFPPAPRASPYLKVRALQLDGPFAGGAHG